ncbi:DNA-processing protein DprA [Candidatus Sumerlaeota bacterium]|nr:DNA-processing protein DprA [Candidatus Sumerlaeota bacterium]
MRMSPNTQAILLLAAPLLVGKSAGSETILSPREYKLLARRLRELGREPADLLGSDAANLMEGLQPVVAGDRLRRLLDRGFQLSQAMERWASRAIWVLSRADEGYPKRLKARCKEDAPAVLYGCGDDELLDAGGLAIVGSRDVDEENLRFTRQIAGLAAEAGRAIVSGGARGVDQAAMGAALQAGGRVIGVLADSLERAALNRENREYLMDGRLRLISPFDPFAGFNVGNAMQRNKYIYALADAALVVKSDFQKGGTWQGAQEQLEKYRFVPVYVGGDPSKGLQALRRMGGRPWPNPVDSAGLDLLFSDQVAPIESLASGEELPLFVSEGASTSPHEKESKEEPLNGTGPVAETVRVDNAEALFSKVREILQRIDHPMTDLEIAEDLGVSLLQVRKWLKRMTAEGSLQKTKRPVRYLGAQTESDLFTSSEGSP